MQPEVSTSVATQAAVRGPNATASRGLYSSTSKRVGCFLFCVGDLRPFSPCWSPCCNSSPTVLFNYSCIGLQIGINYPQNLNPGQDTREQTTKRTHERRHEGTHEGTHQRKTNQPTSHSNLPAPPHSHTRSAPELQAGRIRACASSTDSSARTSA